MENMVYDFHHQQFEKNPNKLEQIYTALEILCQQNVKLKIKQVGTSTCKICNKHIQSQKQQSYTHNCLQSYHDTCLQDIYIKIKANQKENIGCLSCKKEYQNYEIIKIFKDQDNYNKTMEKLFKNCIQCDKKGYIMKMTQHLCDKYIHNECLANIYKESNPNLGYDVVTKCKHCNGEFFKEQIELAYGIKKIEDERNKINMSYIRREDQLTRQQWKKQAEERSFDCQICFGEQININKECRTLDNCLHQFCESCLKEHILNSYLEGYVNCPLCAEIPVEERKFPDPQIPQDKPHDPNKISISVPIIQDLLNKQEFEKLQTRWMNILYIEEENKKNKMIQVVLCPGFKKIVDQSKLQKNKIKHLDKQKQNDLNNDQQVIKLEQQKLEKNDNKVEEEKKENLEEVIQQNDEQANKQNLEIVSKDIFKKKLSFGINKLGFEIQQCEAIYEYETTQLINKDKSLKPLKISCVSCKLDFCPLCMDVAHNKSCENYKKWNDKLVQKKAKKGRIQQDQLYLQQIINENPQKYKFCPNCKNLIEKNGGCNRVNCAIKQCRKSICWICLKFFDNANLCYRHIGEFHPGRLFDQKA